MASLMDNAFIFTAYTMTNVTHYSAAESEAAEPIATAVAALNWYR